MKNFKNIFKRAICMGAAACLLFSAYGCGSGKTETSKEDDESEPYEILWYYVGESNNADQAEVQQAVSDYVKEKINATVKMVPLDWGPYNQKMSNMMSSGEKCDLRWVNGSAYQAAVFKGAFIDINDLLTQYAPKTRELLGEKFLKGATIDGKLYGVPANKDKAHYYSIFYRKDIAEKYNLDFSGVNTWEGMYPAYDKVRDNEPKMYAYGISSGRTPWSVLGGYEDFGGNKLVGVVPSSNDIVSLYETDEFKKCADIARDMFEKGYIYKDCAVDDNAGDLINQGRVFARIEQSKPGKLEELNANGEFQYGEVQITQPISNASDAQGSMMAIPITCKNPIRVMKFVELLNTDKYLNNLVNFGIEGKHYNKVGDNRITLVKDSGYSNSEMQWVFGNIFENYLYDGESDDKYEVLQKFNDDTEYSPYSGFVPNLEAVKIQVSSCGNVIAQYGKVLEYGVSDSDEVLPAFLGKLKQAGIDEVVEEVKKQYEQWKSEN